MNAPVLAFKNVSIRFDPHEPSVIDGVTFEVAVGARVALTGLNGSGKTTLLSAAAGLVPYNGEIFVLGERLNEKSLPGIREKLGFLFNVPEDQLLFPTALEDVAFGLLRRGVPKPEAAQNALRALVALGVDRFAQLALHHLSHGQKQRVALAGALVTKPALLLLDEPSAGLDPPGKRALADILSRVNAAVLVATHDLEFAERFCTRFLALDQGRIAIDDRDATQVRRRWD